MRSLRRLFLGMAAVVSLGLGCTSTNEGTPAAQGGSGQGSGGSSSGGTVSTGGSVSTGGTVFTGGSPPRAHGFHGRLGFHRRHGPQGRHALHRRAAPTGGTVPKGGTVSTGGRLPRAARFPREERSPPAGSEGGAGGGAGGIGATGGATGKGGSSAAAEPADLLAVAPVAAGVDHPGRWARWIPTRRSRFGWLATRPCRTAAELASAAGLLNSSNTSTPTPPFQSGTGWPKLQTWIWGDQTSRKPPQPTRTAMPGH